MNIEIYPCSEYKGIFCPYMINPDILNKNPSGSPCNRNIMECKYWRENNFPKIKERVEREVKIAKHNLKKLEKITLNFVIANSPKTL